MECRHGNCVCLGSGVIRHRSGTTLREGPFFFHSFSALLYEPGNRSDDAVGRGLPFDDPKWYFREEQHIMRACRPKDVVVGGRCLRWRAGGNGGAVECVCNDRHPAAVWRRIESMIAFSMRRGIPNSERRRRGKQIAGWCVVGREILLHGVRIPFG